MKQIPFLSLFLLLIGSSTLYGMENDHPEEIKVIGAHTKVSREDWNKIRIGFLDEACDITIKTFKETANIPIETPIRMHNLFEPIFDNYYEMYKLLLAQNRKTLEQIMSNREVLLNPLGQFVGTFESFFDGTRTYYRTKTNDYVSHKSRLETQIFPIVQRTFNLFMQVYQEITKEKLGNIGPLQNNSGNFSVLNESQKKHIFYKRDKNGFLLFSIYPHEKVGKNHFETYVPYYQPEPLMLFSLDGAENPVLEPRAGLILKRTEEGYQAENYRGDTTTDPYIKERTMVVLNRKTATTVLKAIDLEDKKEILRSKEEETHSPPHIEQHIAYNVVQQQVVKSLPDTFRGDPIQVNHIAPQKKIKLDNLIKSLLGDEETLYIPFPRNPLEECEETYLLLVGIQQRVKTGVATAEDNRLLNYFVKTYPEESLDDIVQGYEEELVAAYTSEVEEKIRLEQEERSRMVADNRIYEEKKGQSKKQHEKKGPMHPLPNKETTQPSNNNTIPSDARIKARKKLEILKAVNKDGSIKYRKFMQIVNTATQAFADLGIQTNVGLNRGSHGTIGIDGIQSQTLVRPHGGAKEMSVSKRGQKRILTSLVERLLKQIETDKK